MLMKHINQKIVIPRKGGITIYVYHYRENVTWKETKGRNYFSLAFGKSSIIFQIILFMNLTFRLLCDLLT